MTLLKTIRQIKEKYFVISINDANFNIGIKIEKIYNDYLLYQKRYLKDILENFGLKDCKEIRTTERNLS